jgi:hypothetical protein
MTLKAREDKANGMGRGKVEFGPDGASGKSDEHRLEYSGCQTDSTIFLRG